MFDPTYSPNKDAPKSPVIQADNAVYHMTRTDPYGHIFLSVEGGELPEKYRGAYTTMDIAEFDLRKYIEERRIALAELSAEIRTTKKK